MTALPWCRGEQLSERLNGRQRTARAVVGVVTLGAAALATRRRGTLGMVGTLGGGWFGASHLVAARTGYAGCPELGAIPSVILRRDVPIGCRPWRIVDRRMGLAA